MEERDESAAALLPERIRKEQGFESHYRHCKR
jgi:hypothetical protein